MLSYVLSHRGDPGSSGRVHSGKEVAGATQRGSLAWIFVAPYGPRARHSRSPSIIEILVG
jgi:hypothetical protein